VKRARARIIRMCDGRPFLSSALALFMNAVLEDLVQAATIVECDSKTLETKPKKQVVGEIADSLGQVAARMRRSCERLSALVAENDYYAVDLRRVLRDISEIFVGVPIDIECEENCAASAHPHELLEALVVALDAAATNLAPKHRIHVRAWKMPSEIAIEVSRRDGKRVVPIQGTLEAFTAIHLRLEPDGKVHFTANRTQHLTH
jgi:hypothetical protein